MQKVKEISLAHYHQGVSSSNEYAPVCKKNLEIQIEYVDLVMVQHIPNSCKQKHNNNFYAS